MGEDQEKREDTRRCIHGQGGNLRVIGCVEFASPVGIYGDDGTQRNYEQGKRRKSSRGPFAVANKREKNVSPKGKGRKQPNQRGFLEQDGQRGQKRLKEGKQ